MALEKGKGFNIVDWLIVLIIAALAVGVYVQFFAKDSSAAVDVRHKTSKVRYDIEIRNVTKDFAEAVKLGEPIRDSVKGNNLGVVADSVSYPASMINMDAVQGKFVKVQIADLYDVRITIEADANVTPTDILVDGTDIRVGKRLTVKGKGYAGVSFVLKVDLEQ